MTYPEPARSAGIIKQQVGNGGGPGKKTVPAQFLPDLCSVSALAVLVLTGELLALVLVLAMGGLRDFSWQRLGAVSLTVQWVVLPGAALLCQLRPLLARLPHKAAGGLSFAVTLLVLVTVLSAQEWWRASISRQPFDSWSLAANVLLGAICAGVVLRYAYLQQLLHNQQRAELEARINALQSRIRPHFLFNSMNSLASLIAVDPQRAERLVEDLSSLFRASLADAGLVPVQQEVALARRYLQIESLRLGARLRQSWRLDDDLDGLRMPSMMLQPLLENAVLHGVARLHEGGEISVTISRDGGRLRLRVENPIPPAGVARPQRPEANGIATENIRHRLAAHYGNRFRFSALVDGDRYRVELLFPGDMGAVEKTAEAEL
ncbi:sensor histidine kinase [Microbulbifer sp. TYP-18]|uniref:sensor histidine kinase n=1 Tax=Microbulbifer sp. TYP-18 TaxID=3230024 RepID=UPI0034C65CF1